MSRERVPARLRQAVIERAQACCEYCASLARYSMSPFAIDHILPLSRGGQTELENLALVCQGCNGAKYNKITALDPISNREVPLFHPRQQRWRDHFAWNAPCTHIVGLTPTGRATIVALQLNRFELLNLREVLYTVGDHPPEIYMNKQSSNR
ncbi:MAG TPA: HNH endonuclease [Caldilineaceae bacterium]|nr:HNH endonuclease [Caldilineaceae bacterium]